MTALERIKEIQAIDSRFDAQSGQPGLNIVQIPQSEIKLLIRAFQVMREITITQHRGKPGICIPGLAIDDCVDAIFEKKMKT